jgi:hypothetical protein
MGQATPRIPWIPESHPFEDRHLRYGEAIPVMADGIEYEWIGRSALGGRGIILKWIDQGVAFFFVQSRTHPGGISWRLNARLDGESTEFAWRYENDNWLKTPEVIRRQVERACYAVTEEFNRVSSEKRRIADIHDATEEARAAAARRKLLEHLGDD